MVTHSSIEVLTKEYNCLVKITDDIRQVVEKSKIRNGVVYVITAHTTTGIAVMKDWSAWNMILGI